eukprot:EC819189.1.p1 GENE.EC819189.1~~EC819189.1.p1  ORF type:complete len:95 (+),score=22.59 EC819189.1:3-287(+)
MLVGLTGIQCFYTGHTVRGIIEILCSADIQMILFFLLGWWVYSIIFMILGTVTLGLFFLIGYIGYAYFFIPICISYIMAIIDLINAEKNCGVKN